MVIDHGVASAPHSLRLRQGQPEPPTMGGDPPQGLDGQLLVRQDALAPPSVAQPLQPLRAP